MANPSNPMPPLTYSIDEAAHLLGISKSQAYALAHKGEIPTVRLGKRFVIPRAALHKLVEEQPASKGKQVTA